MNRLCISLRSIVFLTIVTLAAACNITPTISASPTLTTTTQPNNTVTHTSTFSPNHTSTMTLIPATKTITPTNLPTLTTIPNSTTVLATPSTGNSGEGSSLATAVIIDASDEFTGIIAEREWLTAHYPGYQKILQELIIEGDKVYDAITIMTAEGKLKTIYFDITSFYGKLP